MSCPHRLYVLGAAEANRESNSAEEESLRGVFRPLEALGVEIVYSHTPTPPEGTRPIDVVVVPPTAFTSASGAVHLNGTLKRVDRRADTGGKSPILLIADPADPIPAVVAGRSLRETAVWDIVRRDAPPEEMLLRIERLVGQATSLQELERVRYQASHDDRTALLRPGPFEERLREHFSAAQRHRLEFALVLVDLDRFGAVNKSFDHTVGDELIARAGAVIRMALRAEDVGARIGGDEFALILPYTKRVAAARVVARLAAKFKALSGPAPPHFAGRGPDEDSSTIHVSASLGFDTFDGEDITSPEELRRRAERALLHAKRLGGDRGVFYRSLGEAREPDEGDAARSTRFGNGRLRPLPNTIERASKRASGPRAMRRPDEHRT